MIIHFLRIIGLAPFTVQFTKTSAENPRKTLSVNFLFSRIAQTYNIIFLVFLNVMAVLAFPDLYSQDYPGKSNLTQYIDILQSVICGATSYVVIITWIIRQKYAVRTLNRLLEIDRLLYGKEHGLIGRKVLISFLLHTIFNASLWIFFCIMENIDFTFTFLSWFSVNVPYFVIYWFIVEYFIVVGLLMRKFESVNKNLLLLKEFPEHLSGHTLSLNGRLTVLSLSIHKRLVAIRLLYTVRTMLSEVTQDVADFFSLPILLCIGSSFFSLVYNCYYLIIPALSPNNHFSLSIFSNTIAWIFISIYPLLYLSFNVTRAIREVYYSSMIKKNL